MITDDAKRLAPDDAWIRQVWRKRVLPELKVPCSLHLSRSQSLSRCWGCAWRNEGNGRFHIAIKPGLPRPIALDTLIHELAHLDGIMAGAIKHDDHGPIWGVSYSHWYQIVMGVA
jgi:hypothetical protein